jgi:sugar lactone lactonase YvrE
MRSVAASLALSLLAGCQLYSLSSACGDGGSLCINGTGTTTGGTGTGTGTTSSGSSTGGVTAGSTTGTTTTGGTSGVAPGAPTNVLATASKLSANVAWTAPASGGTVAWYSVTVESDGGLPDAGVFDAGGALSIVVPGLTAGQSYTFAVVGQNAAGVGPPGVSNAVIPFDVPGAPVNINANAASGEATVTWVAGPDGFSPITGYVITVTPGNQVTDAGANATSVIITGLADFTPYTFSVAATNAAGTGPAAISDVVATFAYVTTLAGSGDAGWMDGPGSIAAFRLPIAVAVDSQGTVYVGDTGNNQIRKVAPDGTTTTLAGDGGFGYFDGTGGVAGTTQFGSPAGVAVDANGNVYVADRGNSRIRVVAPDGTTTTLAGNGDAGWADGVGANAAFAAAAGVALNPRGELLVADTYNMRIRKVLTDGTTTTLSGSGDAGFVDGTGDQAAFFLPYGISVGPLGNAFVGDLLNNRVRRVAPDGTTTTMAGNGDAGSFDGTGGPFGTASFYEPLGTAVDAHGNIYVADIANNLIRKIAPDGTTTTLAGDGDAGFLDGPARQAQFYEPTGVAVDSRGVLYVADFLNNRIRVIVQ